MLGPLSRLFRKQARPQEAWPPHYYEVHSVVTEQPKPEYRIVWPEQEACRG